MDLLEQEPHADPSQAFVDCTRGELRKLNQGLVRLPLLALVAWF